MDIRSVAKVISIVIGRVAIITQFYDGASRYDVRIGGEGVGHGKADDEREVG